jgi:hypothetical protein
MIFTSQNRILTINGKAIERKTNTLSFAVDGTKFPTQYSSLAGQFTLIFYKSQNVSVNFGDGTVRNYTTDPIGSDHQIFFRTDGASGQTPYTYTDGNAGTRIISFTFSELIELKLVFIQFCTVLGAFPVEIGVARKLETLSLRSLKISTFPTSLTFLNTIKTWNTRNAIINVIPQISEGLFNSPLETLTISGTYDLSDLIASNFFKIDQLKNTLLNFQADTNNINAFPDEIIQCNKLKDIRCDFNNFSALPIQIESLPNLEYLLIGNSSYKVTNSRMLDFSNSPKLQSLLLRIDNLNLTDLVTKWAGLKSLTTLGASNFNNFTGTNARFNEFIDVFYTLCTTNGSILNNGAAAPYPNRFRNIAWGHSSLTFTGTKTAPPGYVQGVSNGTPANQGQKAFVLQNQYSHTITHG